MACPGKQGYLDDLAVPTVQGMATGTARFGTLLCLVSAAGFGLGPVFAKAAYAAGAGVPTVLALRFTIAAAVLWAVVAWRRPRWPGRRVLLGCVALGAVGYAAQSGLYYGSLTRIDASLAALMVYVYPALVVVLALALRRERPQRRRTVALVCSACGVALLLGMGGPSAAGGSGVDGIGVLLALGAAVVYACYLTVVDGLPADLDLYLLSAVVCTSAATSLTVAGLVTGSLRAPTEASGLAGIAMLALVSTILAMGCQFAGIRVVGASTLAILSCAEPAVAVAATAVVYGERLTAVQCVGGLVVLASVAVLQLRRRPAADVEVRPERYWLSRSGGSAQPRLRLPAAERPAVRLRAGADDALEAVAERRG